MSKKASQTRRSGRLSPSGLFFYLLLSPIICSLKAIVLPWVKLTIYALGCTSVGTSPLGEEKNVEKLWRLISELIIFSICPCAFIFLLTSFSNRHHLWRQKWDGPYCIYWLVSAHWWVEYWALFISIQCGFDRTFSIKLKWSLDIPGVASSAALVIF